MAEAIGEDCELIEFGSGSGLKTRLLLEQLRSPRAYLPVDISREPLERSAADLAERFPGPAHPARPRRLHRAVAAAGDRRPPARRVVYFPGLDDRQLQPRGGHQPALHDRLAGRRRRRALDRLRPRQGRIDRLARLQRSPRHQRGVQPEPARADQPRARRRLRPGGVLPPGRLRSLEGTHGDVSRQPRSAGRAGRRDRSLPSTRARRSTPRIRTSTRSSTSAG